MIQEKQGTELSLDDKNSVVYALVETTILSYRESANTSKQLRRQFDEVEETLEGLKQELGEQYVVSMKDRLESIWTGRASNRQAFGDTRLPVEKENSKLS